MKSKFIYALDSGDGYCSFHRVTINDQISRQNSVKYKIGPWEKDEQWTPKAFESPKVKMEDHGDGVRLKIPDDVGQTHEVELDYAQVEDLRMLLDAFNKHGMFESKILRFNEDSFE